VRRSYDFNQRKRARYLFVRDVLADFRGHVQFAPRQKFSQPLKTPSRQLFHGNNVKKEI